MNLIRTFENRVSEAFGSAPQGYTAPISFKRLARAAAKEMEAETYVIDGVDTAPALYTILVSPADDIAMRPLYPRLTQEVAGLVKAEARSKEYVFVGEPLARFLADPSLRSGKFVVFAENVDAETLERLRIEEASFLSGASVVGGAAADRRVQRKRPSERRAVPAVNQPAAEPSLDDQLVPIIPKGETPQPRIIPPAAPLQPDVSGAVAPVPVAAQVDPSGAVAPIPASADLLSNQQADSSAGLVAEPAPAPEAVVMPIPEPVAAPEPAAAPVPEPAWAPVPAPVPAPMPAPAPAPAAAHMGSPAVAAAPAAANPLASIPDPLAEPEVSRPNVETVFDTPEARASLNEQIISSSTGLDVMPEDFFDESIRAAQLSTPDISSQPYVPVTQRRIDAVAAPSAGSATCTFVDLQTGQTYVGNAPSTQIGRERITGAIILRDPNVSRRHAELTYDGISWYLRDLASTNGTLVNNREITKCRLHTGDIVTLGLINLEFREG